MKKLMIFVGALTLTGSLFAQKPASDDARYSLEGLANLNTSNGMSFTAPSLRLRYFATDNIAARVQFGFGGDGSSVVNTPSKESHAYANPTTGGENGTVDIARSAWDLKLGAEYHLSGTDKMSPYFTANIGFGKGSEEQTWTNVFYSNPLDPTSDLAYANGFSVTAAGGYSTFSWGLGAGFDYYVADNLYLGLELNLTSTAVTNDDVVKNVTTPASATPTTYTTLGNQMTYTNIGAAHGSVRIGWRF
ncbi:MAG: outer membrane beta-barrel protein [Flavobacteriales bacterium]